MTTTIRMCDGAGCWTTTIEDTIFTVTEGVEYVEEVLKGTPYKGYMDFCKECLVEVKLLLETSGYIVEIDEIQDEVYIREVGSN